MLELRQLRHFVAVAEELNFRRASLRLRMRSAAFGVSIQHLEQAVGAQPAGPQPAPCRADGGGRGVSQGRGASWRCRRSRRWSAPSGRRRAWKVRCRCLLLPSAALELLPALFKRFQREYPTVHLQLSADTTARQLEALHKGDVDLAIVVGPLNEPEGLRVTAAADAALRAGGAAGPCAGQAP